MAAAGCRSRTDVETAPRPAPATRLNPPQEKPTGAFLARYFGVLPCSGCEALQADLTLYRKPDEYRLIETYYSTPQGDKVVTSQGRWITQRGTPADENATIYQLDPDRPDEARNFLLVGKDRLRPLNRDRREIDGAKQATLVRRVRR